MSDWPVKINNPEKEKLLCRIFGHSRRTFFPQIMESGQCILTTCMRECGWMHRRFPWGE